MIPGTHVWAVVESGQDPQIAHFLKHEGDKEVLQLADGGVVSFAKRAPEDYDEKGGGETWHPIAP